MTSLRQQAFGGGLIDQLGLRPAMQQRQRESELLREAMTSAGAQKAQSELQSQQIRTQGLMNLGQTISKGIESHKLAEAKAIQDKKLFDFEVEKEQNKFNIENQKLAIERQELLFKKNQAAQDYQLKRNIEFKKLANDLKIAELELKKIDQRTAEGKLKAEDVIRKEHNKNIERYQVVNTAKDKLNNNLDLETPQGDLAGIINFVKINDPTSIVKESEAETVARAASLLKISKNKLQKVLTGEKLDPEQREQLRNAALATVDAQTNAYTKALDRYKTIAANRALNLMNITGGFEVEPVKMPKKNLLNQKPKAPIIQTPTGASFKGFNLPFFGGGQ